MGDELGQMIRKGKYIHSPSIISQGFSEIHHFRLRSDTE